MPQNKSWGGARQKKSDSGHGMLCTRKGCRQCLLLKTVDEDLHPSDIPQRSPWTYEPCSGRNLGATVRGYTGC